MDPLLGRFKSAVANRSMFKSQGPLKANVNEREGDYLAKSFFAEDNEARAKREQEEIGKKVIEKLIILKSSDNMIPVEAASWSTLNEIVKPFNEKI